MEVRKGYKQTDIGIIPSDWEIKKLSSFAELTSSKRIFESDYVSSGIPFYRGKEISLLINNAPLDDEYFILEEKYNEIKRQFGAPRKGDILITAVGTLGNVYLIPNDNAFYFKDGNLIWLRNIKNVLPDYLTIQLRNRKTEILNNAIGSTQKALTIIVLNETLIPIPPTLAEQEAIAEALSDADALIEAVEQLLAKKRQVKQGAMSELLTGKRRLSGFSGEWEVKKLGEVCGRVTTGKLDANAMKENGEFRFYTCAREYYQIDTYAFDTEALLVSGNGANVGYIHYYKGKFNAYQRTYVLSDFSVDIFFIKLFMDQYFQKRIKVEVNAGNTPYIKMDTLTEMEIQLPPTLSEQTAIAEILSDMDAEISALEGKLVKARQVKAGMMSVLLTGKIRLV